MNTIRLLGLLVLCAAGCKEQARPTPLSIPASQAEETTELPEGDDDRALLKGEGGANRLADFARQATAADGELVFGDYVIEVMESLRRVPGDPGPPTRACNIQITTRAPDQRNKLTRWRMGYSFDRNGDRWKYYGGMKSIYTPGADKPIYEKRVGNKVYVKMHPDPIETMPLDPNHPGDALMLRYFQR